MVPTDIGSREDLQEALERVLSAADENGVRVTGSFRCEASSGDRAWETLVTDLDPHGDD
jgi:hypothetical protein